MNIFKYRPLLLVSVFFVAIGFLCLRITTIPKLILGGILLIAALVLFFVYLSRKKLLLVAVLLFACAFQCALSLLSIDLPYSKASQYSGEEYETEAYVYTCITSSDGYYCYGIKTVSIDGKKTRLTLSFSTDEPLELGQRFTGTLNIFGYPPEVVPNETYLYASGIHGESYAEDEITCIGKTTTPYILASKCRETLAGFLDARFSEDTAALLRAMILGDRSGMSAQTSLTFHRTGITHLLALSGTHITLLTFAVLRFLGWIRVPKKAAAPIAIVFVLAYSLLVGLPLSILRAAGMSIVLLIGYFIRRERDAFTSLAFSVVLILICSPRAILDIGFWLSAFATLGILVTTEYKIGKLSKRGFFFRLLQDFISLCLMTVFASLFTLPIVSFLFGEISLLSLPANLIFPSLLNFIIYLGLAALPLPFLRPLTNLATDLYLGALAKFSGIHGVMVKLTDTPYRVLLMITFTLILLLLIVRLKRLRSFLISFGVIGVFAFSTCIAALIPYLIIRTEKALTCITDVFSEDYLAAQYKGKTVVVANGYFSALYAHDLYVELNKRGIYEIDLLYIPHYHNNIPDFLYSLAGNMVVEEIALPRVYSPLEEKMNTGIDEMCETLNMERRELLPDQTLSVGEIDMTPLPRSLTKENGAHAKAALTIRMGGNKLYYASPGYHKAYPPDEMEDILAATDCNILIFGRHGTKSEREIPAVFPLDEHVEQIIFFNRDGYMVMTEEEHRIYDTLKIHHPKSNYTIPCD